MARFFFDTEFYEDGRTIELISIGVVAEDGRVYYAEVISAKEKCRSDWLVKNVRPHLRGPEKSRQVISQELIEFMGEKPEIWAYYSAYDWVVLCQLFGTMMDLPPGWPMWCRDLKQLVSSLGNPELPAQMEQEHYALADALWAKSMWERLNHV